MTVTEVWNETEPAFSERPPPFILFNIKFISTVGGADASGCEQVKKQPATDILVVSIKEELFDAIVPPEQENSVVPLSNPVTFKYLY